MRQGTDVDTNGAAQADEIGESPYILSTTIEGVAKMLFHRYDCASVEAKSKATKGSKTKKSDDTESYYYRDTDGFVCVPGLNLHGSLIAAAKYSQDPRSPRKSAMDIFRAGIVVMPDLSRVRNAKGKETMEADFMDTRRVTVQRNAVPRIRPGMIEGWQIDFEIQVILPELITPMMLREVLGRAGQLCGLCDFRPSYGRFQVVRCEVEVWFDQVC